tara:strand:+ start:42 stop:371 length:330 start_codon:yes stop_codon:yes gene_type:complete
MAVSIDQRLTVFGDRLVVTGTYEAADATIDLSDFLANIDMAVLTPIAAGPINLEVGSAADGSDATPTQFREFATVASGSTTITINKPGGAHTPPVAATGGTFMAIGRRS